MYTWYVLLTYHTNVSSEDHGQSTQWIIELKSLFAIRINFFDDCVINMSNKLLPRGHFEKCTFRCRSRRKLCNSRLFLGICTYNEWFLRLTVVSTRNFDLSNCTSTWLKLINGADTTGELEYGPSFCTVRVVRNFWPAALGVIYCRELRVCKLDFGPVLGKGRKSERDRRREVQRKHLVHIL